MKGEGFLIVAAVAAVSMGWGSTAAAGGVVPPATWMKDLPRAAAVSSVAHGSDAPDTRARAEAALRVMMDVVEALSGVPHMGASVKSFPEPAASRWMEYLSAMSAGRTLSVYPSRPALRYYGNLDFHEEILSKLVSPAAKAAYEASGRYRELVQLMPPSPSAQARAAATPVLPPGPFSPDTDQDCLIARRLLDAGLRENAEARRQKCEEKKRVAADAEAKRKQAADDAEAVAAAQHDPDFVAARASGVDLRVFGIQLGAPMKLSACPEGSFRAFGGPTVPTTCVAKRGSGGLLDQLISQLMTLPTSVPWADGGVPVQLSRSDCPDWLTGGCTVLLHVIPGNIPIGAFFSTRGVDQSSRIVRLLSNKYPQAQAARGPSLRCQNSLTGGVMEDTFERHWQVPGLYVSYSPIDTCPNTTISTGSYFGGGTVSRRDPEGNVTIEFARSRRLRGDAAQTREAAGPKL